MSAEEVAIKANSQEIKLINEEIPNDIFEKQDMLHVIDDIMIISLFANGIKKIQKVNDCL